MATYNYSGFGDLVSGLELALNTGSNETEQELEPSVTAAEDAESSIKDG